MSVIGIDIGNESCYIAVARAGGIETIANEYSQRLTPTYVAFNERTRDLGVTAKNKQITNLKNTLTSFKRLIGRKYTDPVIQQELQYVPYETCQLPNGEVGIEVNYLNEKTVFTVQQVMAMMLTKLKEVSESNLRIKVQDCVISVPIYYTDVERRAILDAAEIAGLNVLRLMNEPTAVALAYGFYKQDLPEDKPKNVVFVDLGQSSLQATAVAFTNGKLKVLGSSWNRNLGGRDFDNVLVRHFVEDFKKRYNLDVMSNKRAVIRLLQECEKLKKQMSANSVDLPLNIECFMEDKDVSGRMKREVFEKLAENNIQLLEFTLVKLLHDTKLKPEEIDSVQIVGGSSRLPAFKALIQKVFGVEPSTTLNQDEAVARGCALQCAMLSPTFKVRDFSITDIQPYPIKIVYKAVKTEEESETEIFPAFHAVPFVRQLTFYRTEPFTIEVHYSGDASSIGDPKLGTFTVMNVTPTPEGESTKVKVKARININGVFGLSSACMIEKLSLAANDSETAQASETTPDNQPKKSEEAMESDSASTPNGDINSEKASDNADKSEEKKVPEQKKIKTKSIDLPIKADVPGGLSQQMLNDLIEKEGKMIMQDKLEKERADAKNAVEEYVYDFRGKLGEQLEKFVTDEEREKLRKLLEDTEEWLYDEGEDVQKSVYIQKLNELKKSGDPIMFRYVEWEQRPIELNALGYSLQLVHKALQSYEAKEELYAHIDKEDMMKVKSLWEQKDQWHGKYLHTLSKLQKHQNSHVTASAIKKEKKELESKVWPILSKPNPKVEPPAEGEPINKQPQNYSEMQTQDNANDASVTIKKQAPEEKVVNQSHAESMEIMNITPTPEGESSKVKVEAHINICDAAMESDSFSSASALFKSFETWGVEDQTHFVNSLILKMSRAQQTRVDEFIEVLLQREYESLHPSATAEFSEIQFRSLENLVSNLTLTAIETGGLKFLTELQAGTIHHLLKETNVVAFARKGNGKRLAYLVPAIQLLCKYGFNTRSGTVIVIISPTEDTCIQTYKITKKLLAPHSFSHGLVLGASDRNYVEIRMLEKGRNILIATARRLLGHEQNGVEFMLKNIKSLIFDVSSKILNNGFTEDVEAILELFKGAQQRVVFSDAIFHITDVLIKKCYEEEPIFIGREEAIVDLLKQQLFVVCESKRRFTMLLHFLRKNLKKKTIIFFSSRKSVLFHSFLLYYNRVNVISIHGQQTEKEKEKNLKKFCRVPVGVLLCSDISEKDMNQLTKVCQSHPFDCIIQFDPPRDRKHYIGRVSRLGRGKSTKLALLMLRPEETLFLQHLVPQLTELKFRWKEIKDIDLEEIVAGKQHLQPLAREACAAYLTEYRKHTLTNVFDFHQLNIKDVAKSFGLRTVPPNMRFL